MKRKEVLQNSLDVTIATGQVLTMTTEGIEVVVAKHEFLDVQTYELLADILISIEDALAKLTCEASDLQDEIKTWQAIEHFGREK